MNERSAIVASPDADGAASAVIAARSAEAVLKVLFMESERLPHFLDESSQQALPSHYELILCGMQVMRIDWDGRLIRPLLMAGLRAFTSPVKWFSAHEWKSEDLAAVAHVIGEENLCVCETAECTAALVRGACCAPEDDYADSLVRLGTGLSGEEGNPWIDQWRRVITTLKDNLPAMAEAISPLIAGRPDELSQELLLRADRLARENQELARSNAEEPIRMRQSTLVTIDIPAGRHPFWEEICASACAQTETEFCLCRLVGRPTLVLTRAAGSRMDLRRWARYVTDMLPQAQSVDAAPQAVPLVVEGLVHDPLLKREVLRLLEEGAHLIRSA